MKIEHNKGADRSLLFPNEKFNERRSFEQMERRLVLHMSKLSYLWTCTLDRTCPTQSLEYFLWIIWNLWLLYYNYDQWNIVILMHSHEWMTQLWILLISLQSIDISIGQYLKHNFIKYARINRDVNRSMDTVGEIYRVGLYVENERLYHLFMLTR